MQGRVLFRPKKDVKQQIWVQLAFNDTNRDLIVFINKYDFY